MECTKLVLNPETDLHERKPKKVFETNDLAIAHCKFVNALPDRTHKVVPYKCHECHKFHVGRNGTVITDKYLKKIAKPEIFRGFKIIGKIDL